MSRRSQEQAPALCVLHPAIGLLVFWGVDNHWPLMSNTHDLAIGSLLLIPTWFEWPVVLRSLRLRGQALLVPIGIGLAIEVGLIGSWLVPSSIVGAH